VSCDSLDLYAIVHVSREVAILSQLANSVEHLLGIVAVGNVSEMEVTEVDHTWKNGSHILCQVESMTS